MLFNTLAERYGWPPQVIMDLTPAEITAVLTGHDPARRTVWVSYHEYMAMKRGKVRL